MFIPRGIEVPKLDQEKMWQFVANKSLSPNDLLTGGDIIGVVDENALFHEHKIMVPPKVSGRIVEIQPEGMYNVT